ncbi:Aquaporin-12B [Halotydeus destructor]|nr:Aquaporin-12B [Halotydeus destructor]
MVPVVLFSDIQYHVIPYAILLFNSVLFAVSRRILFAASPSAKANLLIAEVLATLELCADAAEIGVINQIHGLPGFLIALIVVNLWWPTVFNGADANPSRCIEDCLLKKRKLTQWSIAGPLIGQMIGAYLAWSYSQTIWSLHLNPQHVGLTSAECSAALKGSVLSGFIAEAVCSFILRSVILESSRLRPPFTAIAISSTILSLYLLSKDSSGAFFNPILASAFTLNCKGNSMAEHLIVYWIGSLSGSVVARKLHMDRSNNVATNVKNKIK